MNRNELKALLAFAGKLKDEERAHLALVQFMVQDDRCWAYSTDGHRAVEADGESDASHDRGEWLVVRQFLDAGVKLLSDDKQVLRLKFAGASLTEAVIEDELGLEVSNLGWPRDAVPAQQTFPGIRQLLKIPKSRKPPLCVTLNADYLAELRLVAAAAGRSAIDCHAPVGPDKPSYFRFPGDGTTVWTVAIMPMRNDAPDLDDDEEDDDSEETPLEGAIARAAKKMKDVLDEHGATMTVTARGKSTTVGAPTE
ncbi:MAG TPA: hypothetical protein VH062_02420 [Polyangiaceae bacterium]|nr:hypothetical protein [Polyangiaceae bacterium]